MRCLDLTLPTAAENLALDEALLDEAEQSPSPLETLRFWEPSQRMVVLGRSSRREHEVHSETCCQYGVPILRRASGGATIVTGPGCLMYAVILDCRLRPALRAVDQAHHFVLDTLAAALRPLMAQVTCRGISDLVLEDPSAGEACQRYKKFSGNSMRVKRDHLLYHGTLLYDFPLEWIAKLLAMPPRRPDYRVDRPHDTFVTNLGLSADALRAALAAGWGVGEPCRDWPRERTARLVLDRYGRPQWNELGR